MRLGLAVVMLGAVLLLAATGCGREERGDVAAATELQGAILILLDTVRADHLSGYGYERPTSPHLDALAEQGVRFEQAVSYAPWTLPSVAALLAAEYPARVFEERKLTRSLAQRFQQAGFTTAAFTEGGYVSRAFGMDRGFGHYQEEEGPVQFRKAGERRDPHARGGIDRTFAGAKAWLSRHRTKRFFLFIHTYEPHTPYTNHDFTAGMDPGVIGPIFTIRLLFSLRSQTTILNEAEVEYAKALYDGDIRNSDRHVGELLSFLEEIGLRDRTLLVVTSDHGEELDDHYPTRTGDHGHSLRDPQLLVPLILYDPMGNYRVRRVRSQVRLIDVLPTIADILGVSLEHPVDGSSLVPLMNGTESADRLVLLGRTRRGPPRIGLRTLGFKFVVTEGPDRSSPPLVPPPPRHQLYDLKADPGERRNLADERPKLAAAMQRLLRDRRADLVRQAETTLSDELDPALLQRLKSLGYIE